ncbi:MAG: redox-sensing transcriptional repressor Rex [Candidatus Mcinerneyibacterium aminivorans]|uniref:Redox-sensing transcriptional repressor Rex n=1 Tax=Candidatus Mcinerneyibacterium aminivorans TaxID=2703815 RepID=A0A5D0MKQ0_9BACT|nr:MAG: redox-sensing transcriptional repressor Rex [Candidatus Mcinerneyibacterium aminivorans]
MVKKIPKPSLARLPKYYQVVTSYLNRKNEKYISSSYLSDCLNIDDSQIRRDLMYIEIGGIPRVGYDAKELRDVLADYLGYFNLNEAILVGVGNLGTALAEYKGFERYGLSIVGLFDSDPEKIGNLVGNLKVDNIENLEQVIKKFNIKIGIITTPARYAQQIAEKMIKANIKAIWNFAPVTLDIDEDIFIQDENLAENFSFISHYLKETEPEKE